MLRKETKLFLPESIACLWLTIQQQGPRILSRQTGTRPTKNLLWKRKERKEGTDRKKERKKEIRRQEEMTERKKKEERVAHVLSFVAPDNAPSPPPHASLTAFCPNNNFGRATFLNRFKTKETIEPLRSRPKYFLTGLPDSTMKTRRAITILNIPLHSCIGILSSVADICQS